MMDAENDDEPMQVGEQNEPVMMMMMMGAENDDEPV